MSVRFELGRSAPALRGRSQAASLAGHALIGAVLIVAPAFAPGALPDVRAANPRPLPLPPTLVLVPPRPRAASARRTPAAPTRGHAAPAAAAPSAPTGPTALRFAKGEIAAEAGRLLDTDDLLAEASGWGGPEPAFGEGLLGGLPGPPNGPGDGAGDAPREIGGELRPPKLLFGPAPRYPELARQVRLEGEVVVECVIDAQGLVREARVVRGPGLLREPALAAVSRWRYAPTLLNGRPVAVRMSVSVRFELR